MAILFTDFVNAVVPKNTLRGETMKHSRYWLGD